MSAKNPNISDPALTLLSRLLTHGGFTSATLSAAALGLPLPEIRRIHGELIALGYLRKVLLLRPKDSTAYLQITRRAARLLGALAPNCSRSSPSDSQILRGLVRFWLATSYLPARLKAGEAVLTDTLARAYFESENMTLPASFPAGDVYTETPTGLQIRFIISPNQALEPAVKQAFLRYIDDIRQVKIGFVVDRFRAPELASILSEITGTEAAEQRTAAQIEAELKALQGTFDRADAMNKVKLHPQLIALRAELQACSAPQADHEPSFADVLLPSILHDFY